MPETLDRETYTPLSAAEEDQRFGTLKRAVDDWASLEGMAKDAELKFQIAFGGAYAGSDAKNDRSREAEALVATEDLKAKANHLRIDADAAYHTLIYLRNHGI